MIPHELDGRTPWSPKPSPSDRADRRIFRGADWTRSSSARRRDLDRRLQRRAKGGSQ